MDTVEYKNLLVEMISALRDKAEYLRSIDSKDEAFNKDYFDGMAMAYHQVLDFVKSTLEDEEELQLEDFGLSDFDPNEILSYKPMN